MVGRFQTLVGYRGGKQWVQEVIRGTWEVFWETWEGFCLGGPSTTVTFEEDLLFLPSMGFRMGSQQTLILVTPLSGFSFPTLETRRASQPLVHDMYVTGQITWAVQRSWFPTPWPHLPFSRRGLRALDLLRGRAPGPRCLGRYGAGNGETQPAPG